MKEKLKNLITWSFPIADRDVGDYGKRERNAFLIAMFGQNIMYGMVSNFQSVFYTTVIFVPTIALTIISVISRVFDAFTDIMMGTIADRTRSRWGKFRPYLKYVPIPIMLLTILIFMPIRNWNDGWKLVFVIISWLSWETAYTLGDIPLWGMTSVITPDETKRSKLISAARIVGSVSGLVIVAFDPLVSFFSQLNLGLFAEGVDRVGNYSYYSMQQGYLFTAILICLVGGIMFKFAFPFTRERVEGSDVSREASFSSGFKQNLIYMWQNKPFMLVMASLLLGCTRNMVMSAGIYFCLWVLANGGDYTMWLIILGGSFLIPMLISMGVATGIGKKFGKKRLSIVTSYVNAIPYTLIFFIVYFGGISTLTIALAAVLFAISGFLTGFTTVYPTTMVADCTDYMEWKTGKRLDGVYFSGLNFQAKLQSAITLAITYVVFAIVNYTPTIEALTEDIKAGVIAADSFVFVESYPRLFVALLVLITIVPAVGSILQALPLHFYKLDEKTCDGMMADLIVRRAEAQGKNADVENVVEVTDADLTDTQTEPDVAQDGESDDDENKF